MQVKVKRRKKYVLHAEGKSKMVVFAFLTFCFHFLTVPGNKISQHNILQGKFVRVNLQRFRHIYGGNRFVLEILRKMQSSSLN